MFRRSFAAIRGLAAMVGLIAASAPGPEIIARAREYPDPVLPSYQGSGGHRRGRNGYRPKGGISGAGLWRKCRAGGRVRGW